MISTAIRLYRIYTNLVSPDRFLVRRSVSRFGRTVAQTRNLGQCVDIGSGTSPHKAVITRSFKVDRYCSVDIAPSNVTDIVGDACALPLSSDSADLVLSVHCIQHIGNYLLALKEMVRVTRSDGFIIVIFPFIYGECDVHDFRRWTLAGMSGDLERLGCSIVKAEPCGGIVLATVECWVSAINNWVPGGRKSWRAERSMKSYFREIFLLVIRLPFLVLAWIAMLLDKILPASGMYTTGIVFATKSKKAGEL